MYASNGQLMYRQVNGAHQDHYYLGKKLVAKRKGFVVTYVHTDFLGSPVAETDAFGVKVNERMHYQPFGEQIETPKDEVGYTGHKYDKDLGLSYMQARYYDPVIGRFYSNDPVGFKNVHNFNRYAYANNNPYKYVDPDGQDAEGAMRASMAFRQSLTPRQQRKTAMVAGGIMIAATGGLVAGMSGMTAAEAGVIITEAAAGDALGGASIGGAAVVVTKGLLSKGDRIKMIVDDIGKINAKNADDALKEVNRIVDRVEDAHSGVKKVANPGKAYDGRMYGPRNDSVTRHSDGSITAKINKGTLQISADGKVTLSR